MVKGIVSSRPLPRVVACVVAVMSVVVSMAAGPVAADERIVTEAEAFVERDGGRDFDDAFEIHDLDSAVVDPANVATAHARRCTGCQAVAISFQIVLVQGPVEPDDVGPKNLAVALNEECTGCDAAAGAYQFVVGQGEPIRLTPAGYKQLARVRFEVARLQASRLSGPAIVAKADKLADEVRAILGEQVQPVDEWTRIVIDDRRFKSVGDGPPTKSSTKTKVAPAA